MALFLSESVQTRVKLIPLEEALSDLVELHMQGTRLSEAILQADFILHEDTAAATTSEKKATPFGGNIALKGTPKKAMSGDKEMGFLERSWEAIKAFARKVKLKVMQVYEAVKNKLTVWYHRIMKNTKEVVVVSKSKIETFRIQIAHAQELTEVTFKRKYESESDQKEAIDNVNEKYEEKIKDVDTGSETIKVSKTEIINMAKTAQKLINDSSTNTSSIGEEQIKAAEAALAAAKAVDKDSRDEDAIKKAKAKVAQVKNTAAVMTKLSTLSNTVASRVMSMMTEGTANMDND